MTIKEYRTMIKNTQREFAKKVGVSQATINNWEQSDYVFGRGKQKEEYLVNLEKIGIDFSGMIKPSSMNFRLKEGFKIW